jgi:cytochrome c nitrite reductase small subunit
MFKSKPSTDQSKEIKPTKDINWLKVLISSNIVIVALIAVGLSGMALIHQSDINPNFCATCHVMQANVTSYLNSSNLDHAHQQAGVACKNCHDYPVQAEIASGINFITGNYEMNTQGTLNKRTYPDAMCLKCHISQAHVAESTDFLYKNPHSSHLGDMPCSTCHISHGQQIDYCSSCHDNGGQRMIGQPIKDRGKVGGPVQITTAK